MLPRALHDPRHRALETLGLLLNLLEHRLGKIEALLALVAFRRVQTALALLVGHVFAIAIVPCKRTQGKRALAGLCQGAREGAINSSSMLGLGRVFEGGIAGFFIALSSCGGDAFSVAADAGGNDSISLGADANPAGDSPLAAGSDWCATQGSHTFCEDFSEGVPGQLMSENTAGAALSLDTTNFPQGADPPRSMLATTPNLPDMGDSAAAIAVLSFPDALGVHDIVQADFDVASSCFDHGDKDGVTVLALSFAEDRYLIAKSWSNRAGRSSWR